MTAYTIFSQESPGQSAQADATEYTLSMQFTVSETVKLTGIWFYSASGAQDLPVACGIFQMTAPGAGTLIASDLSPSWSGAAASGWVKDSFPGSTELVAGKTYRVAVAGANAGDWYAATGAYFTTGAGAGGLSNGPLSAPGNSGADVGQDGFTSGSQTLTYPTNANGGNYWVDVEVTTIPAAKSAGGDPTMILDFLG